jgi:ribosomal protein S12 methylthiotransferase accessory factor
MQAPDSCRIILEDAHKTYTQDQDKTLPPEETVRRFRERLRQVDLEILRETVRIDTGRLGIPVYFSRCGKDARAIIGNRKQMGKGATPAQAEASAVMELAERFSFFSFAQNPAHFIIGTFADLRENALPFSEIAKSVHDDSGDLGAARRIFETLPLKWTWGYSLTRQQPVLIPFDWFFTINAFNGPSAGNCREEALLQGICEVVERHVCGRVSRERLATPAIRPESATDPVVREMLAKYAAAGVTLHLSDFTLDTGIPTVAVVAHDPTTFPHKSEIVWTAGTTPGPEKALSRALTETAQLAGDFNTGGNYVASGLPKPPSLREIAYVTEATRTIDIGEMPDLSHDNIRVEIESLVSTLSGRNMDVLAIDTTHPALGVPAFYTIIPGARFRERAAATSVGMFSAKLISESFPPDQAVGRLTEMERILPGKYYVQFYLGTAHLALGEIETALDHLNRSLDLAPNEQDLPSIYSYLGVGLKETGRYKEALSVLEKGAALDPDRTDIHNLMGFCHFKLKAHEKAIDCFQQVLRLDPGSAIDYANIGVNYRDLGETEKAMEYFLKALTIDPSIEFARENLDKLRGGG